MQFEGYTVFVRPKEEGLGSWMKIRQLGILIRDLQANFLAFPEGTPISRADGHYEIILKNPGKLDELKLRVSKGEMAIICWLPRHVRYAGNWDELMPCMKTAKRHNFVFQVDLPVEEYELLKNGGLERLKKKMPKNMAALLQLFDNYPQTHGVGPVLQMIP